ncbi:hypothetical protein GCM10025864_27520 [Luteimicrobium album]|uniref:FAD-dependent oxidoreductase n=1 Tax=Luteimicrobium album TaxID=1054550 RepID=A0ABQ6I4B5_9MICO|nr:hypothetical protein GCM10025864_27520 [Luteimicrobium album]
MSRVVVVGAGVAGLGAAALLAQDGHDVTVVERLATVGGRVGVWRAGGFTFDLGPSWYLMPEVFERFFSLLGTSADAELDLVRLPTAFRAYFDDAPPLDVTDDVARTARTFEAREPGAGSASRPTWAPRAARTAPPSTGSSTPTTRRRARSSPRYAAWARATSPSSRGSSRRRCGAAPDASRTTVACARCWRTRRSSSAPRPTGRPPSTTS